MLPLSTRAYCPFICPRPLSPHVTDWLNNVTATYFRHNQSANETVQVDDATTVPNPAFKSNNKSFVREETVKANQAPQFEEKDNSFARNNSVC